MWRAKAPVGTVLTSALVLTTSLSLASCKAPTPQNGASGGGWPGYGGTTEETHFADASSIDVNNVGRLGLAWSFDLPPGNTASIPVEQDGVLYVATGYSVVRALDVTTGKELWNYDPDVAGTRSGPTKMQNGWGIRGLAFAKGRVFFGTQDGRLIALNAKTGAVAWSVQTLDQSDYSFISGAPRIAGDKVIIGNGGADSGVMRGFVTAYDLTTGRQAWRFYTVPGDPSKGFENDAMRMAARTWTGEWWKYGGGGTVWNAITYDPETQTVFIGTGNGTPWNQHIRSPGGGDNLFLCSIVALDARTGAYKWHYQINPGETWDYNAAMDMPLATLTINGVPRKVIMQAPKNGFFYVIDRETGKLISAKPYDRVTWATGIDPATGRPKEDPGARFPNGGTFEMWPGPSGAHNWYPMSFSPLTGFVYIPITSLGATYSDKLVDKRDWHATGADSTGVRVGLVGGGRGQSSLLAWDPVAQRPAWRMSTKGWFGGGTMATAGGLVFQGQIDGRFIAYDGRSGKMRWSFDAGSPVVAPPISYSHNGRQYVTVLTGISTSAGAGGPQATAFGWQFGTVPRRVLTFALDATGRIPGPPAPRGMEPAADPTYRAQPELAAKGGALYHQYTCRSCHGIAVISGGSAPDLRASQAPQSAETFANIVRGGALAAGGMPRFDEMKDSELEAIRQYLRSRAAEAREAKLHGGKADDSVPNL